MKNSRLYYNVKNSKTGEVWENVDSREIAKRLGISHITVGEYARTKGYYKDYEIKLIPSLKNSKYDKQLRVKWDEYVPKLNKKIKELDLKILIVEE